MEDTQSDYLEGRILVAMPVMGDSRFERSVILVCVHSKEGAMGIVLNRLVENLSFSDWFDQIGNFGEERDFPVPDDVLEMPIHFGGPMDQSRGFVVHSNDIMVKNTTLPVNAGICLTASLDILKAIALGQGPVKTLLALGYAGWRAGQLESEIKENGWLVCDPSHDLVFEADPGTKYEMALRMIGIDPAMLSSLGGQA